MKFRVPEMILGAFLTVAVFAVGAIFSSTIFTPNQTSEPANHNDQPKEKNPKTGDAESSDDRIAKYTLWLAILTGALVAASGFQGYFLIRSDKTARIAANAANRQARVAESALFAVEIPYLYVVIKSHEVIVEGHVIKKIGTMSVDGIGIDEIDHFEVINFCFENVGRTPAEIIEYSAAIVLEGWPPAPVIPSAKPSRWATEVVAARDRSKERGCSFGAEKLLFGGGMDREREALWFKGYVRYADVFRNEYVYGFCLGFSTVTGPDDTLGEFYTSGGDDYNYRKQIKSDNGPTETSKSL
jgi:hypothetical protein